VNQVRIVILCDTVACLATPSKKSVFERELVERALSLCMAINEFTDQGWYFEISNFKVR
jgi:hypothetical protein